MRCPKCKTENSEGVLICGKCGYVFSAPDAAQPPGEQPSGPAPAPRKFNPKILLIGCLALFLVTSCLLAVGGGAYYFLIIKKKPVQSSSIQTETKKTKPIPPRTPEETDTSGQAEEAKKPVREFYRKLMDGKYQDAGIFLSSRAKKDWYNTDFVMEDVLKEVKVLSSKVTGKTGVVKVKETWSGANGTYYQQYDLKMVKENGKWLIDLFVSINEQSLEGGNAPAVTLSESTAWTTVDNYLSLLRQNRTAEAEAMVTENFLGKMGSDYFNATFSESFISYSITSSTEGDGYYVVEVHEEWISGPETVYYTVVQRDNQLLIDYIDWGQ